MKYTKLVEDGRITDAMSVAAILKIKLMIADGRISQKTGTGIKNQQPIIGRQPVIEAIEAGRATIRYSFSMVYRVMRSSRLRQLVFMITIFSTNRFPRKTERSY